MERCCDLQMNHIKPKGQVCYPFPAIRAGTIVHRCPKIHLAWEGSIWQHTLALPSGVGYGLISKGSRA